MLVKLVNCKTIKPGDKLLRGLKIVTIEDVVRPYKKTLVLFGDNDVVYCQSGMKLLKVIHEVGV